MASEIAGFWGLRPRNPAISCLDSLSFWTVSYSLNTARNKEDADGAATDQSDRRALGGAGRDKAAPQFDMGTIANIVTGLIGGGVVGQIVSLLLPRLSLGSVLNKDSSAH